MPNGCKGCGYVVCECFATSARETTPLQRSVREAFARATISPEEPAKPAARAETVVTRGPSGPRGEVVVECPGCRKPVTLSDVDENDNRIRGHGTCAMCRGAIHALYAKRCDENGLMAWGEPGVWNVTLDFRERSAATPTSPSGRPICGEPLGDDLRCDKDPGHDGDRRAKSGMNGWTTWPRAKAVVDARTSPRTSGRICDAGYVGPDERMMGLRCTEPHGHEAWGGWHVSGRRGTWTNRPEDMPVRARPTNEAKADGSMAGVLDKIDAWLVQLIPSWARVDAVKRALVERWVSAPQPPPDTSRAGIRRAVLDFLRPRIAVGTTPEQVLADLVDPVDEDELARALFASDAYVRDRVHEACDMPAAGSLRGLDEGWQRAWDKAEQPARARAEKTARAAIETIKTLRAGGAPQKTKEPSK